MDVVTSLVIDFPSFHAMNNEHIPRNLNILILENVYSEKSNHLNMRDWDVI